MVGFFEKIVKINTMIKSSVEINRKPDDVFAYIAQLDKHGEWQEAIISSKKEPKGPTRVGTRNTELRKMPGGPREVTSEVIEYNPPKRISAKGIDNGPMQALISISVKPVQGGLHSKVTFELELIGRGIGKLFVGFARRKSKKQVPKDLFSLKQKLEDKA